MYKASPFLATPNRILIIKTSSLGDIIQAFSVLNDLHRRFPAVQIDWAVEENFASIVASHPLIHQAIPLDIKGMKMGWRRVQNWRQLRLAIRNLRKKKYDLIFDLQGNCKSGLITLASRGKVKIGFGPKSVREWPNLLATRLRFEVPKQINIRLQYVQLIQQYFNDRGSCKTPLPQKTDEVAGVYFKIDDAEKEAPFQILNRSEFFSRLKIMVCPGSKWINKQLPLQTLIGLLTKMESDLNASFLLVWGAESEKAFCEEIQSCFPATSYVVPRLPIPSWQNLMGQVDLVLAVDSSALHLCGTTPTPSFSIFGPTAPAIFKPIGPRHFAFQGKCPYGITFDKLCPALRTCATGACIRNLDAGEIFTSFRAWWQEIQGLV